MGVVLLLPFLVIDLAVASILMAMGMVFVSPTTISLPLKLLLFVLADGWNLIVRSLLESFR
jgi:flagellar biosynthetic protein FliP